MNWTKSKSFLLSKLLVEAAFLFLIAILFVIPPAASWYDTISDSEPIRIPMMIVLYLCSVAGFLIITNLYLLLKNIQKHEIFIEKNTTYLRFISWGLMLISLFMLIFTIYLPVSLGFAFLFGMLGLVLRVLKNVFEEAVSLKSENDYTI